MFKRLMMRYVLMDEAGGGDGGGAATTATGADAATATAGDGAAAAAAATAAQESAPSFLETLGDADLKAYAESKGYKTAAEAIKAFRDAETANAAPAKAEDYKLPVPEGQSDELAKAASTWFHEAGVSQAVAEALVTKFNAHVAGLNEAAELAQKQQGEQQMAALKTEWGTQYDKNVELGRQALHQFGIPAETVSKLEKQVGAAQILKTFSQIGAALGEGTLNPGGNGGNTQTEANWFPNSKHN